MRVIGLTGGIGTGKSEVSRILSQLGASIIDADKVGHEAYLPRTETWQEVVKTFGREILQSNEEIDRKKLGAIVFSDPKALEKLNEIVHPRIYKMIEERIKGLKERGEEEVVVEAALLIEANWAPLVDEIWVTTSPQDEVVRRTRDRSGLSEDTIRSRIRSQLPQEQRVKHADVVIENNEDLETLRVKVKSLWNSRIKGRQGKI